MAHGDLAGVSGGGGAAWAGAGVGADVAGRRYGLAPRSQITPVWARCCWAMMLAGVDPGPSRCDGLYGAGRGAGAVARTGAAGAGCGLLAAGGAVIRAGAWRGASRGAGGRAAPRSFRPRAVFQAVHWGHRHRSALYPVWVPASPVR